MAQADWSFISDVQSSGSTPRAPATPAVIPLPAGATWTYGMHSLTNTPGCVALYSALANFTPTAKGADLSGGLRKGGAGGSLFSNYFFSCLSGQASTNTAYMLGLSDSDPAHIILRKGTLATGLPDVAPGTQGVLRRSTATIALGTWVHVRLEAVLEPTGDIVLNVYKSDLAAHDIDAPVWVAVPGMDPFTDDVLQINTGSAPLAGGRVGFGATLAEINRIAAFAWIPTARQLTP